MIVGGNRDAAQACALPRYPFGADASTDIHETVNPTFA